MFLFLDFHIEYYNLNKTLYIFRVIFANKEYTIKIVFL